MVLLGILGLTRIEPGTSALLVVAILFVIGLGHGMIMPAAMGVSYKTLRHSEIPSATTATNVGIRAGSSSGVAALLVLIQRNIAHRTPEADTFTHAFSQTYWWALAIGAVAILPALMLPRQRRPAMADTPRR